jgi:methylated-DNA-[protein]-cysteine S-methyltransferase
MSFHRVFFTDLGWMGVTLGPEGIARLVFDQPSERAAWRALGARPADPLEDHPVLVEVQQRLTHYASGKPDSLRDIPIDWSGMTAFQRHVLGACRRIPRGKTLTYAQLAQRAGSPKAARAVGRVMAGNRLPLIIPCHRVVGSGGRLGGFSSRSGLTMKERLLKMEAQTDSIATDRRERAADGNPVRS